MKSGFGLNKSVAATTASRGSPISSVKLGASDVLEALANALNSRTPLVRPGLVFEDCTIHGRLELSNVDLPIPISFKSCVFDSPVVISNCHTLDLSFSGSRIPSMDLSGTVIDGNFVANDGFVCTGELALRDARVTGVVTLESARLVNPGGKALNCSGATFDSIVLLRNGFHAKGEVRFLRAAIAGNLQCRGATFENPGGIALAGC